MHNSTTCACDRCHSGELLVLRGVLLLLVPEDSVDWFSRSGSVMCLVGASATFRLAGFFQQKLAIAMKHGIASVQREIELTLCPPRLYQVVAGFGYATGIVGTAVWGTATCCRGCSQSDKRSLGLAFNGGRLLASTSQTAADLDLAGRAIVRGTCHCQLYRTALRSSLVLGKPGNVVTEARQHDGMSIEPRHCSE